MNKRIIICGPSCSGKTYLKNKFIKKGFLPEISYTTRQKREGEIEGKDYYFINERLFNNMIENNQFHEYIKFNDYYYGTSVTSFKTRDIFIMETKGIKLLSKEDRDSSFIIYLNCSLDIRKERMLNERKWDLEKIEKRLKEDEINFKDFKEYDIEIINEKF